MENTLLIIILLVVPSFIVLATCVKQNPDDETCAGGNVAGPSRKKSLEELTESSGQQSLSGDCHKPSNDSSSSPTQGSELRSDFTPVSLPAIKQDQRELLRSSVKNWNTEHDSQVGAILYAVGMTYRSKAAKEAYMNLKAGDRIILKPEPDNIEDDTAVRVYAKRCHIGYIPQKYSSQVYWHCTLDKIYGCYVVKPPEGLKGMKFVIFLNND